MITEFLAFWKNYPRKQDKKKAEKAFNRLNESKKLAATIDCKTRFLNVEMKFIPLPTTYINGERWEDEVINERPKQTNADRYLDAIRNLQNG